MKSAPLLRPALFLLLSLLTLPGMGANPLKKSAEKLDLRIRRSAERFIEMQKEPGKRIPAELLARARGIIILHRVKAGLVVGGEAGNGVALVRDKTTGVWSAPAF
ncbi:MAG: hypothetical protein KDN18_23235, partial [Verrucomicrobiae bacterium]|nr:hypothetical protein [Verrucomicrobiae bacterium]